MASSIEKRGKDSYRLACTNGYDLKGKLIKHTKTIHGTKKDTQTELGEDQIKYKVAIILAIFTGVRLGELMGLEWQDVDFKTGIVSINRSS